jgi:hypothetical protein
VDKDAPPQALTCTCDASQAQKCIRCRHAPPAIKVNFVAYKHFMDERKAVCKFKHAPTTTCAFCASPVVESYVGKKDCNRGHKPWPYGVCLNCAPPNAHLRLQVPYQALHACDSRRLGL